MPLVTSTEMFKKAYDGGYAIGAFNVNNMEIVQAIVEAAWELHSPVILQASAGARKYAKPAYLKHLSLAAIEATNDEIPIVMHLDHGADFETCKDCVDTGFTSVMIDGSSKPFEENVEVSRQVAEYAHEHGVVVEGELGTLAGVEDDVNVSAEKAQYTDPDQVVEFVERTKVDSLAIAIGTSHGAYKFKPGTHPHIRLDILEEIVKKLPGFPIVLHGSSSVPPKYVEIINANGGGLKDAVGIPENQLREAAKSAVCKINIDSDLRLGMTAGIREHMAAHPDHFDPRQYVADGRAYVKEIVRHKIVNVLGSDNKV
ncbi:MAG: class II fructose-1,6-bisphosphate aldolase [Lachnospiraceae bacterium]|nr:class II fructose-1,6-bisphosphate aldolase [Lachnospiraceae bacterium]